MPSRKLVAWAWTALILVGCWTPGYLLEEDSGPAAQEIPHLDKLAHGGLFAVWGVLWIFAVPPRRAGWVLAGGTALAVVSELGQGLEIVQRDPGLLDVLADIVGLAIGVGLALWLARRGARRASPAHRPAAACPARPIAPDALAHSPGNGEHSHPRP